MQLGVRYDDKHDAARMDIYSMTCDAEEVARLTVAQRRCLHPVYARTRWSPTSGTLLVENGPDGSG